MEPVSIVIPAWEDQGLFERNLPALLAEVERRDARDEVVVVDDSGKDLLRTWFASRYPSVRGVVHRTSRGQGIALLSGARAAKHDLVLCLDARMRVQEGFLDPLTLAMRDERTLAASARVVQPDGAVPSRISALLPPIELDADLAAEVAADLGAGLRPILCVEGRACLVRKAPFSDGDWFGSMYAPRHWEPLDMSLGAWRRGLRIVEAGESVVEHPGGRSDPLVPDEELSAASKNRALALWKHLDEPDLAARHVAELWERVLDPSADGWLGELRWLRLALDHLSDLAEARGRFTGAQRGVGKILRTCTACTRGSSA